MLKVHISLLFFYFWVFLFVCKMMVPIQWSGIAELAFLMEQFHTCILVVLGGRWGEGRLKSLGMVGS